MIAPRRLVGTGAERPCPVIYAFVKYCSSARRTAGPVANDPSPGRSHGRYTCAALVNAQHELTFRKRRVRDEGKDTELDRLVAGWGNEIQRLRGVSGLRFAKY